jgi:uncharacterized membrane protein YkgB
MDPLDQKLVHFMKTSGISLLRIALAIVFIWFGLLKVIGKSPVVDLVSQTIYWAPPNFFVPFLGIWEVVVGLGLLFRVALRLVLFLFWIQLAGTFMVLVLRPDIAFQGMNPFLLTTEGEFVIKNLVLITSGIVVGGTVRRREKENLE